MEGEKATEEEPSPPLPSPPPPTTSLLVSSTLLPAEMPTDSVAALSTDLPEDLPFSGNDALPTPSPPLLLEASPTAAVVSEDPPPPPLDASPIAAAAPEDPPPPQEEAPLASVLTEELREKIVRQVEYYFSDENLPTDNFLLKHIKKNKDGFVPIPLIASFRKMKKLVQDNFLIVSALRTSTNLIVSSDGKKVKRLRPLPEIDTEEAKLRTILVKNLPENCSHDFIQEKFAVAGNIKRISIQGQLQKSTRAEISRERASISHKLHAYVEYEMVEAAKKAVASLNDESDWRTGLRVERLGKQVGRHGQTFKGRKGAFSEDHISNGALNSVGEQSDSKSSDQRAQTVEQEEKHSPHEKSELKIQNRRRGRTQQQYRAEGHGRGSGSSFPRMESTNRPVLGPRMPDGTRGFTMGRGKPSVQVQRDG